MPRKKKLTPFEMVKQFHETYDLPIAETPGHPPEDRIRLRKELISEEYWEYDRAVEKNDLVNIAQELADLFYVVVGAALEYGIPLCDIIEEVHNSNMSKLGDDGKPLYREDGKVLKSNKYHPPNIERVLFGEELPEPSVFPEV